MAGHCAAAPRRWLRHGGPIKTEKMKRLATTLFLLLALGQGLAAQDDGFRLAWHGMVNPVLWGETRDGISGREGMMYFYPKPVVRDAQGNDINGTPTLNMLAITARLNLTIQGPDVLGAKMKGFIEGDFTGSNETTINCFRLRHAYLDMRWNHDELLAGQYWYPMVVHEIMPNTQPLNMGAPFHPYARYSQVRYTRHQGHWEAMGAASFQLDNKSQGPAGGSTAYLKRSCVPEMTFQFRYNDLAEGLFFGAAYNLLAIRPDGDHPVLVNHTFSLFARYDCPCGWSVRAQTLLNNNLYEGCTMGGYYYAHPFTGILLPGTAPVEEGYHAWHFNTVWLDISKTQGRWRPGVFMGYGYNDSEKEIREACAILDIYGRGMELRTLWRVQPHLTYAAGNGLSFTAEMEYTCADYTMLGKADNLRLILSGCYAF